MSSNQNYYTPAVAHPETELGQAYERGHAAACDALRKEIGQFAVTLNAELIHGWLHVNRRPIQNPYEERYPKGSTDASGQ